MPVPYNVDFELAILSKNQDDGLQILEQILPYFQPTFNITVQLNDQLQEKKDFPVVLNTISYDDDYEGDYTTRRTLIYTITFTCKTYIGTSLDGEEELIRKAIVDTSTDNKTSAPREMRYTVEPDPITSDPDDDFGFNELFSTFNDGKSENRSAETTSKFDKLIEEDALDVETSIVKDEKPALERVEDTPVKENEAIKKDYEYTRGNLYSLIDKGQERVRRNPRTITTNRFTTCL